MSRAELLGKSSKEIISNPSIESASLPYAAVPLHIDQQSQIEYNAVSLERIRRKLGQATRLAVRDRWVEPGELAGRLGAIVDKSLTESHEQRVFWNRRYGRQAGALAELRFRDERAARALEGVATPGDLLSLLRDYRELGSLELAKLSHPFDYRAPEAMDEDVEKAIFNLGGAVWWAEAKYKPKTYEPDIPAMTILRKQAVGSLEAETGMIQIIRRQSFLVRGDAEARDVDPFLDRKINNPSRLKELTQKIEGYLPHIDLHPHLKWLQPIASSYYAKYVTIDTTQQPQK